MTNPAYEATNSDVEKSCKFCGGSGYFQIQKTYNKSPCPCQFCTEFFTPHHYGMMQLSNELAEMKRKCAVKFPEDFPDDAELLIAIECLDYRSTDVKTAKWLKELRLRRADGGAVERGE